jgi:tripartite-type tricarboxylate transporter receptor subunit TctC
MLTRHRPANATFRLNPLIAAAGVLLASIGVYSQAQAGEGPYPAKPVRLLIPAPPGGSTDLLARIVGAKLASQIGQQVVIDNRGGAGGIVAWEILARSIPDGHTLGVLYTPHTSNTSFAKLPYHPLNDFTPISQMTAAPLLLIVNPALAVKSVKDLIALAKAKPIVYGSAGNGSGGHLCGELLKMLSGMQATHVPYKGAGPAAVDVVAGQIQFQFAAQITAGGFMKSGRVRAIAVSSDKRAATLPDLPTVAESGVPGFGFTNWFGLAGPARMDAALTQRVHAEVVAALRSADVREKLSGEGSEIVASSPAEFREFMRADIAKWAKVVKAAGMKLD